MALAATMSACATSNFHEGKMAELSRSTKSITTRQPTARMVLATTERSASVLAPPSLRVTLISERSMASARNFRKTAMKQRQAEKHGAEPEPGLQAVVAVGNFRPPGEAVAAEGGGGDKNAGDEDEIERDLPGPFAHEIHGETALASVQARDPTGVEIEPVLRSAGRDAIEVSDEAIRVADQIGRSERGDGGDRDGDGIKKSAGDRRA